MGLPHPTQVSVESAGLHEQRERLLVESKGSATAESLLLDYPRHESRRCENPAQSDGGRERLAHRARAGAGERPMSRGRGTTVGPVRRPASRRPASRSRLPPRGTPRPPTDHRRRRSCLVRYRARPPDDASMGGAHGRPAVDRGWPRAAGAESARRAERYRSPAPREGRGLRAPSAPSHAHPREWSTQWINNWPFTLDRRTSRLGAVNLGVWAERTTTSAPRKGDAS
ncbi:hypothetical protein RCH22_001894 [Cryobacterium psychrotolerans]|nr:hypothetical protein [Cryobacterium psychrotolerans]